MHNLIKPYLFLFYLLIGCGAAAQTQNLRIQGTCQGCSDQKVYILQLNENGGIMDSVNLKDERFHYETQIIHEQWFHIGYQAKNGMIELFVKPNEQVEIQSKADEPLSNLVIKGSPASLDRLSFTQQIRPTMRQKSQLQKTITELEQQNRVVPDSLLRQLDGLNAKVEDIAFESIRKTNSLLLKDLNLVWINSPVHARWIKNHLDSLAVNYADNYNFQSLQKSFDHYLGRILAPEKHQLTQFYQDFAFLSLSGDTLSKEQVGDRYLYIEFWASWCKPCRAANRDIQKQRSVFQDPRLYPLFVSLDQDLVKWKQAIAEDSLQWANHGIDGYDPEKSFATRIGVSVIPTNILVDPKGVIVLQNAKPAELKAFLDKL